MPCRVGWVGLVLLAFGTGASGGDDALKQALALEEAIQQAAAKAEPSVACILVSRSEAYAKYDAEQQPEVGPRSTNQRRRTGR